MFPTMTSIRSLSRRRLLYTSLVGVPLLAACSDPPASRRIDEQGLSDAAGNMAMPDPTVAAAPAQAEQPPAPDTPRPRVIVLDPGHGADEVGAASAIPGLPVLTEKD